jgi:hypothetical protein
MTKETAQEQMHRLLFANLVMMLSASAMQLLGKTINPATQKTDVDLNGAQTMIDMLVMIREKTKGNLDAREARMLGDIVADLQMNFVETSRQAKEPPAAEPKPDAPAPQPDAEAGGGKGPAPAP